MKILFLMALISFSSQTWAGAGKHLWQKSNMKGKVHLLNEYRHFFQSLQEVEKLNLDEIKSTSFLTFFMSEAWASENMDCIYAGWPSRRVGGLCSSPQRQNPEYESSCGSNQMQCQPLLFGKGLCVPTGTRSQRNLSFTNCDKQFSALKKSPEDLVNEIRSEGKEDKLFELMDFAEKICQEGKQAGTGMCKRLQAAVARLREVAPTAKIDVEVVAPVDPVVDTVIDEATEIVKTVEEVNQIVHTSVTTEVDCPPEESGSPFERVAPRDFQFEYSTQKASSNPAWDFTYLKDKREEELRYTGFTFSNDTPSDIIGSPLDPQEKVERQWRFVSTDNSQRETYLWVTDDAGSGRLSQLMESVILIVPRKMKPSVEEVNGDVQVTLSTGEKVIYDKTTHRIKGGALSEGKVDLNPNRFERKFAPVKYNGSGISIRADKRGEDPRLITGNAVITQNGRSCNVPAKDLWSSTSTDFKYSDDSQLVNFLNSKCGNKFKL